jgi:hypothetical protein
VLFPNQIGRKCKNVIVNKPALQAWLHAWTTGASFPTPTSLGVRARKADPLAYATVRRLRITMTTEQAEQ